MRDFKAFVREHLSALALPRRREIKIVDELAAQLEEAYERLIADGLSEDDAWSELQRQMPDWQTLRRELLDAEPVLVRRAPSTLRQFVAVGLARDLRSSVRLLLKSRGFSLTTIVTLAVCLAANTAIFTVLYSVVLRPLPVPDADRIVAMGDVYPTISPDDILSNTVPAYVDRLRAIDTLEDQALFRFWYDTITIDGVSQEVRGMSTTPSLFRVLQVQPALGRAFTEAESEIGADQKVILSHGLWTQLYGGNPAAVGQDLRLGWTGQRYTIVGVMPRGFSFFNPGGDGHARASGDEVQFWIPLALTPAQRSDDARTRYGFFHIARIRQSATIQQVQAQIDSLNAATIKRFPELGFAELGMHTVVTPLQAALTRGVRRILYLLWGGAAFVLLIGALNIANLSLARASVRARELATRVALGASRVRITRQLIVEGLLVAGIAGLTSLALGDWMLRSLGSVELSNLPNAAAVRIDWFVVIFTLALASLVGVLIGLIPAAAVSRLNLNQVLAEGSRLGTGGRSTRHFRRGLVAAQVACSLVLLVGAVLLLASFRNLLAVDAGFTAERVTTATIFPPPSRYPDSRAVVTLSNRVLESIRNMPGVVAAGITSNIPLSGRTSPMTVFPADDPPEPGEPVVLPSVVAVSPGYFETMATPLIRGRFFADTDRESGLRVAILDQRLAGRFWPNQDPIGKSVRRGNSEPYTVVGVVGDVRFESLAGSGDSVGAAYFPHTQSPAPGRLRWIAVKTSAESTGVIPALRSALKSIDPDLPLSDIQTMTERTGRSVTQQKLAMGLASLFGGVALFLSVVGVYGVLAYLVAQRTREIGIRIALGSSARGIFRLVFQEGLAVVGGGLTLGLLGALALGRAFEGQVFGVRPTDPLILAVVTVSTGVVALAACIIPARRAMRVDPLTVLSEQ